jgi:hypothetical protein
VKVSLEKPEHVQYMVLSCYRSSRGPATYVMGEKLHTSRKQAQRRAGYWRSMMPVDSGLVTVVAKVTW